MSIVEPGPFELARYALELEAKCDRYRVALAAIARLEGSEVILVQRRKEIAEYALGEVEGIEGKEDRST